MRLRTVGFITTVVILCVGLSSAQTDDALHQPLPKVPKTVDQAVLILKSKWLSPSDRDWILRNPKERLAMLHMGFGTAIRNEFKLWGGNPDLMASCRVQHPDSCSSVIIERLWESVRSDADPELVRQLDCQFEVSKTIHIDYTGFHKLTTGELLDALQTQIDSQIKMLNATGRPLCQKSLKLRVQGHPDNACFVDADFAESGGDAKNKPSLEMILGWLGVRNLFTASYYPPEIVLDFNRKCQFPTPPYLYGTRDKKHRK